GHPRRAPACQPPLGDPRQDLQAIQFLHAQREGSSHPGTVPEKRTSLLWRNRTFALGAYRGTSEFGRSVNFCASPEKGLYFGYLLALLLERLNTRPSRHLGQSRRDLFEAIERAALRPLPARPYELALWARPKVSIDYHVELEDHYYSVPWQLRGARLDLRATATTVELFQHGRRVASHVRSHVKHQPRTDPAPIPAAHRAPRARPPSRHRRDEETLPTTTDPPLTLPHHANIRGSRYYH